MSGEATGEAIHIDLPAWLGEFELDPEARYPTAEERMALVIELSRRNVTEQTGGPFGAAIFERTLARFGLAAAIVSPLPAPP